MGVREADIVQRLPFIEQGEVLEHDADLRPGRFPRAVGRRFDPHLAGKFDAPAQERGEIREAVRARAEAAVVDDPDPLGGVVRRFAQTAEDRKEFLAEMGLTEPGLNRLIRAGYQLLDLVTYFTVGPKEARAWTITRGTKAPQAAAVIHSDFERGFIRAETIAYDDYVTFGGETGARQAGKMRLEGKAYAVADGDVMHFRFAT